MTIEEVLKETCELKKRGRIISNYYYGCVPADRSVSALFSDNAIVFDMEDRFRRKAFFFVVESETGKDELAQLLSKLPKNSIIEYIQAYRGTDIDDELKRSKGEDGCEIREIIKDSGFEFYKKYIRNTITYLSNPKLIPEEGRRKILQEMYDDTCGEFPSEDDAEELFEINCSVFDHLTDDVFTIDEWKDIIRKQNCIVYRENGEIISYYVFELQNEKKLYSNIAVNKGAANTLYNIERRIFEYYWNQGIRVYYSWVNEKNRKALVRHNPKELECIKNRGLAYNFIYKKQ